MPNIVVSKHAEKRIKKRMGIGKKASQRTAERAYQEGINYSQANGSLKRYFGYLYATRKSTEVYKIWHEMLFIFNKVSPNKKVLITVVPVPKRHAMRATAIAQAVTGTEG